MKNMKVLDLCMCAVCVGLHIVFELFCTIRIGNDLKITFTALPFLIIAYLCGPVEGLLTGLVGTFLSQLLTYGLSATTVLWMLPYAAMGLVAGLVYRSCKNKTKIRAIVLSTVISGIVQYILTQLVSYLDGVVIFKYYTIEALLLLQPIRLATWAIITLVYTLISIPLVKALLKYCPAGQRLVEEK